jgi:hypothetical protein
MTAEGESTKWRSAQSTSPIALLLIDLVADPTSALRRSLRLSDLFMFRRTCKEAWTRVKHETLSVARLDHVAYERTVGDSWEPHVPLLRLIVSADLVSYGYSWNVVGQTGDETMIVDAWKKLTEEGRDEERLSLFCGLARRGHEALALRLLDDAGEGFEWDRGSHGHFIAQGGCLTLARRFDDEPSSWLAFVGPALREGREAFVRWVLDGATPRARDEYMGYAASSGCLSLLEWLAERGWSVPSNALVEGAKKARNLPILCWLSERGAKVTRRAVESAVLSGDVDTVDWLLEQGEREREREGERTRADLLTAELLHLSAGDSTYAMTWHLLDAGCPYDPIFLTAAACASQQGPSLLLSLLRRGEEYEIERCLESAVSSGGVDPALLYGLFSPTQAPSQTLFLPPLPPSIVHFSIYFHSIDWLRFSLSLSAPISPADVQFALSVCPASVDIILTEVKRRERESEGGVGVYDDVLGMFETAVEDCSIVPGPKVAGVLKDHGIGGRPESKGERAV